VSGGLVDQHCSVPEFLEDDCPPPSFRGNAELLARTLGVEDRLVEPYLAQFTEAEHERINDDIRLAAKLKVRPEDTYSLAGKFAFLDMIKRAGVGSEDWLRVWFARSRQLSGVTLSYPTIFFAKEVKRR
jgi:hypothetical protein